MILLELDPDVVRPGWTPLVITVLLGLVIVLLFFSMRKQFRKISIPREGDSAEPEAKLAPEPDRVEPDPPAGPAPKGPPPA